MLESTQDHYWSVSVFECWVLVSDIHYDAFWTSNKTLAIIFKQIEIWNIIPNHLASFFVCSGFVLLKEFHSDFPILCLNGMYLASIRVHNPAVSRRGLMVPLHPVSPFSITTAFHNSAALLIGSDVDFL